MICGIHTQNLRGPPKGLDQILNPIIRFQVPFRQGIFRMGSRFIFFHRPSYVYMLTHTSMAQASSDRQ